MVLRPEGLAAHSEGGFVSAWEAIVRAEKAISTNYHLVRQPDHARLSGEIAGQLSIAGAPVVDDDTVRGISLHDEGWSDFDCGRERLQATPASYSKTNIALSATSRPLSFLEIKATDFLRAWTASIEVAEAVASIAGLMVSGHFRRIGQFGMNTGTYSEEDTQRVREFLAREEERERKLLRLQGRGVKEVQYWIDVLQFCDLLSLYLCCGSEESVEFPQRIAPKGETIRLRVKEGVNVLSPSPFAREAKFSLEAQLYPVEDEISSAKLNWCVR
jgi:Protein of unknown function (DUF3891)